eukprot:TRINITY_DN34837_c0_g1_i2.p1 TRINITY_DN34837_c0_g1~~TRINITY_DN34837_c0_g1_i2.p1  ORF type:complete len:1865 (+),score=292.54 TRINITY_DN34837_c0_g1_i2:271-5595(+)
MMVAGLRAQHEIFTDYAYTNPIGGTRICSRRVDLPEGWESPFNVQCNGKGVIYVGSSVMSNQKCITVDQPVTCAPSAADVGFRLNADEDFGLFDVTTGGNTVCVRRIDRIEGWSMDLRIGCNPATGFQSDAIGDVGFPTVKASSRRRREAWLGQVQDPAEANVLTDGMLVWLKHGRYGWYTCTLNDCQSGPFQAADRFRIYTDARVANAPVMNGDTVYFRHEVTLLWMTCDKMCSATSACPLSSSTGSDFSACFNERFKIWSSAGTGPVRDGDVIWLQHSGRRWLMCSTIGDPCLVDGLCAGSLQTRAVMQTEVCQHERFKIFAGHIGQKTLQSPVVRIGPSEGNSKCVDMTGDLLTCARNAGDRDLRWPSKDGDTPNATFEITVRGPDENPKAYQICARRLDAESNWDFELRISCTRRITSSVWPHDSASAKPRNATGVKSEAKPIKKESNTTTKRAKDSGRAGCSCVTIDPGLQKENGGVMASIGGAKKLYPPGLGSRCEAWDDGLYPNACEKKAQDPGLGNGWCIKRWCYVDPCSCDVVAKLQQPSFMPEQTYRGLPLHVSYATCGDEAPQVLYSADPGAVCVEQETFTDCDMLSKCSWTDGRCLRKDLAKLCQAPEAIAGAGEDVLDNLISAAADKAASDAVKSALDKYKSDSNVVAKANDVGKKVAKAVAAAAAKAAAESAARVVDDAVAAVVAGKSDPEAAAKKDKSSGNHQIRAAIPRHRIESQGCWEPHQSCVSPFRHNSKWFMGCVKDAAQNRAFCAKRLVPNSHNRSEWDECRQVSCKDVCFRPAERCTDPFEYQGKKYAGCVQEPTGQAWCSHVPKWENSSYERGEWSFCSTIDCGKACWAGSHACVPTVLWKGNNQSGCIEGKPGVGGNMSWCSMSRTLRPGDPDWVFCKQLPCDETAAGLSKWASGPAEVPIQPVAHIATNYHLRGTGMNCLDGETLYSGRGKLDECSLWCSNTPNCRSFQHASESIACEQCVLSSSSCESTNQTSCDGRTTTFVRTNSSVPIILNSTKADIGNLSASHDRADVGSFSALHDRAVADEEAVPLPGSTITIDGKIESVSPHGGSRRAPTGIDANAGSPQAFVANEEAPNTFSPYARAQHLAEPPQTESLQSTIDRDAVDDPKNLGNPGCPCLGLAGGGEITSRVVDLKASSQKRGPPVFARYLLQTGSSCDAWDGLLHPDCQVPPNDEKPAWCDQAWCFVDPCNCNAPGVTYQRSALFPDATYQGKALAFSYLTCGSKDIPAPPAHAPKGRYNKNGHESDSRWKPGKSRAGSRSFLDHIPCYVEAHRARDLGMYNCRCVGFGNVNGFISTTVATATGEAQLVRYKANTGSSCAAWDLSRNPACIVEKGEAEERPAWCGHNASERWCFVDPCACGLVVAPEPAVMVPDITFQGRSLFYSMATCLPDRPALWGRNATPKSCFSYLRKGECENAVSGKCTWTSYGVCVDTLRQHCRKEALMAMVPALGIATREPAKCVEQLCPLGMALKPRAQLGEVACEGSPCTRGDISRCCGPVQTCDHFGDCGDLGFPRPNAESLFCQAVACSFEEDRSTCCQSRALCTTFPRDKCPIGFTLVEDPGNVTCDREVCDTSVDFSRCCEEDTQTVFIGFAILIAVVLVVGVAVSHYLISRHRKHAEEIQKRTAKLEDTRQDPSDEAILTYKMCRARYQGKLSMDQIEAKWNAMKQVPHGSMAAVIVQSRQRGNQTRSQMETLKQKRIDPTDIYSSSGCTFQEWQAKHADLALPEQIRTFGELPIAKEAAASSAT